MLYYIYTYNFPMRIPCIQFLFPWWVISYPSPLDMNHNGYIIHILPSCFPWLWLYCYNLLYLNIPYYCGITIKYYNRRKFRSYTSDNMDSWKAEVRRVRREKSKKTEDTDARKGRKVAKHCVFPMICGSGGSKSRLAKAAGAEPAGHRSDEKLHAVVARSTFRSQNVQNTPGSDHFWKLRCRKSARRCGAKHILKSKCTKHTILGPLLEVQMSKKCTPLWREAHFEVKMYKTPQCRTTFGSCDVEKVHAVVARSTFPSQNVQNTPCSDHFWRFRCRKSVEKVHAVVARSTFRSQKCKKLRVLSLFWGADVEKVDTD